MRISILTLILWLLALPGTASGSFTDAIDAIKSEDYGKARQLLEPLATSGDARAQLQLGRLYENGWGIKADHDKAFYWISKAAEQKLAMAQAALGMLYFSGKGRQRDIDKAFENFSAAASQGSAEGITGIGLIYLTVKKFNKQVEAVNQFRQAVEMNFAPAMLMLGKILLDGTGVPKNSSKAFHWFLKAAEQHEYAAQLWVATLYNDGNGIATDPVKAYMWALLATAQRGEPTIFDPGHNLRNAIIKKHSLTTTQMVEAAAMAEIWAAERKPRLYRKGEAELLPKANEGDPEIQFRLGGRFSEGVKVLPNFQKALAWFQKAAEQGHANSQVYVGLYYFSGHSVSKDYSVAREWYGRAAEQGNEFGQANLGIMYRDGYGMTPDRVVALMWLNLAATHDKIRTSNSEKKAIVMRDKLMRDMTIADIERAQDLALRWMANNRSEELAIAQEKFRRAAETGESVAQVEIGKLYLDGAGVPQNFREAAKWFRRAADKNNAVGQYWLGTMHDNGQGLTKDSRTAFKWYERAGKGANGDANAQFSVATHYRYGKSVNKDIMTAAKWYAKAADQGLRIAQLALSQLYQSGDGVEQNDIEAYRWCSIVMFTGAPIQIHRLAKSICRDVSGKLTNYELNMARQKIDDWMKSHPKRKIDQYWLRLMGSDVISLGNPITNMPR